MGSKRPIALSRILTHVAVVELHLRKLRDSPDALDANHWRGEVRGWLRRMERELDDLGTKTRVEWVARIAAWWNQLRG